MGVWLMDCGLEGGQRHCGLAVSGAATSEPAEEGHLAGGTQRKARVDYCQGV